MNEECQQTIQVFVICQKRKGDEGDRGELVRNGFDDAISVGSVLGSNAECYVAAGIGL